MLRALVAALVLLGASLVSPSAAPAQTYQSSCAAMTDSITRLYLAYFGRPPEENGFRYWVDQYRTGQMSLAEISQAMATSGEFGDNRNLTNRAFVNWIYSDVLGPEISVARQDYWVQAIDRGYPRGSVMLAFTESREYVAKTNTQKPLAGYLRWYPKGTHWYCSVGTTTVPVGPLTGTGASNEVWADYYFQNNGAQGDALELWTLEGNNLRNVRMASMPLQQGFTEYNWDGVFTGDGNYGHSIEVRAGAATSWIVVFYPTSIGPDRLGWELRTG
ncbi:MAG: DUF4214 domain-containing protein [Actinomycetota bacterium]